MLWVRVRLICFWNDLRSRFTCSVAGTERRRLEFEGWWCAACRLDILEGMGPWMGGGDMIQDVFLDHSTYNQPPNRFEAGTPAIAEAIGLGAACDYLSAIGMDVVQRHESELGAYLYEKVELFGCLFEVNHDVRVVWHGCCLALCRG